MNRVELREEAERDLFDAALWYEQERDGLGFRFEAEAARIMDRIAENPLSFAVIENGVRRALLRTFPYSVFFVSRKGW